MLWTTHAYIQRTSRCCRWVCAVCSFQLRCLWHMTHRLLLASYEGSSYRGEVFSVAGTDVWFGINRSALLWLSEQCLSAVRCDAVFKIGATAAVATSR